MEMSANTTQTIPTYLQLTKIWPGQVTHKKVLLAKTFLQREGAEVGSAIKSKNNATCATEDYFALAAKKCQELE